MVEDLKCSSLLPEAGWRNWSRLVLETRGGAVLCGERGWRKNEREIDLSLIIDFILLCYFE